MIVVVAVVQGNEMTEGMQEDEDKALLYPVLPEKKSSEESEKVKKI